MQELHFKVLIKLSVYLFFPYLPLKKDYPVVNRVVPSATVSGTEGRNCCFTLVSCIEEGGGRIWGCFHLALGPIEGES